MPENCMSFRTALLEKRSRIEINVSMYFFLYIKISARVANIIMGISLKDLIETDNYEQINNLSCSTPFLVSDLDLEKEYANKEVWSTALYFKEISFSSY